MRASDLSSRRPAPYGRALGRTLDPLDYKEGWPANGVQLVGAYALDDDGRPLDTNKTNIAASTDAADAAARERMKAAAAAKARDATTTRERLKAGAAAAARDATIENGGPATTEQTLVAKATTFVKRHPIAVGAGVVAVVVIAIVIFRRRGGA